MSRPIRPIPAIIAAVVATATVTLTAPVWAANHGSHAVGKAAPIVQASLARNTDSVDNFDSCDFVTIFSDKVKVPQKGFLMVWGSINAARDADFPDPATLTTRIKVGSAVATIDTSAILIADGTTSNNISMSGGVPVAKGNPKVTIKASECTSGAAFIASQSLSTLFVKYGSSDIAKVVTGGGANKNV
jgi:hypothetical protein